MPPDFAHAYQASLRQQKVHDMLAREAASADRLKKRLRVAEQAQSGAGASTRGGEGKSVDKASIRRAIKAAMDEAASESAKAAELRERARRLSAEADKLG